MSFFFLALLRLLFFLRVFHVSAPFLFVCSCSGGSSDPCFSLPLSIFKFLISSFRFSPPSLDTRTHLINDPDRSTIHVQTHLQSQQRQFLLAARPPRPRLRRPQAPPPHLPGRLPRPPRPNPRILRRPRLRRPALLPLQWRHHLPRRPHGQRQQRRMGQIPRPRLQSRIQPRLARRRAARPQAQRLHLGLRHRPRHPFRRLRHAAARLQAPQ